MVLARWCGFIEPYLGTLDSLPHRRLQILAKRARVSASGSKAELSARLRELPNTPEPAWFTEQQRSRMEASACSLSSLKGTRKMRVGDSLRIDLFESKASGMRASLEAIVPSDCITATMRKTRTNGEVMNYRIGRPLPESRLTLTARSAGSANLVVFHRSGCTAAYDPTRTVRLVVE